MVKKLTCALGACVLMLAFAAPAAFALTRITDADDSRGLLDIHRVVRKHVHTPSFRIATYARWRAKTIWDEGEFLVRLETFGDAHYDYYALVRSNGHKMVARLYRDYKNPSHRDARRGSLVVWRPDGHSVRVNVPLRRLIIGRQRHEYMWQAQSLLTSDRCHQVCFDFAPNLHGHTETLPPDPTK